MKEAPPFVRDACRSRSSDAGFEIHPVFIDARHRKSANTDASTGSAHSQSNPGSRAKSRLTSHVSKLQCRGDADSSKIATLAGVDS